MSSLSDKAVVRLHEQVKELEAEIESINHDSLYMERAETAEAQLDKVRELKPFPVPLTPNGEQAIWYSELQQALENES